jgi:hypothetical protein
MPTGATMDINETIVLYNRDDEANVIFIERRTAFEYLLAPCRNKSETPPTLSP